MTRILVYSDLHLEHSPHFVPPNIDYDVVVLAGDISSDPVGAVRWANSTFVKAKAILYVPGNHEFYGGEWAERLVAMDDACRGTSVYVLDRGAMRIDGIRFLGCTLWTDFKLRIDTLDGQASHQETAMYVADNVMADYRWTKVRSEHGGMRAMSPGDTLAMHKLDRHWLACELSKPSDFYGPTVVITHMAPHRKSLAPRYAGEWASAAFINELPDPFFATPLLWIHGHTHTSFDYKHNGCRVICNPRGYPRRGGGTENSAFKDDLIIEITECRA